MTNQRLNNAAFVTLTYERNSSVGNTWKKVSRDTNRYLQRVRRTLGNIDYLRAFESHKDGYPHVHILILFPVEYNIRNRGKFLHQSYYKRLKDAWPHGLSDAQSPLGKGNHSIGYILKYLNKSSSSNNLWSKLLTETHTKEPAVNDLGYPLKPPPGENVWKLILIPDQKLLLKSTLKWKRIKLLMWSRHFVETYKKSLITNNS
jgi:hypothetical protein